MPTKTETARSEGLVGQHLLESQVDYAHLFAPTWYSPCKAVLDFAGALVLLALAAPVMLAVAILVKLTSSGPVFYAQTRLGRQGRPYKIYKFRSMQHDCEKLSGPCWSTAGDPRVTRLGHLLRRTHLDELPQLWNVLRGDMSLVGPRPERPEFIPRLEEVLPLYRARLLVRPGVTGLAQVQLPPDTDLLSVRRKLAYDLYYAQHCSLWFDLRLLLATIPHVIGMSYVLVARIVPLPSDETIESGYRSLNSREGTRTHVDILLPAPDERTATVEMASCV
jgi:lipopolysaccharide/colanic/teichoic acid biosynthesis glycosyltransferase